MTKEQAEKAFKTGQRVDFKSRHGYFKDMVIHQLVYEKAEGSEIVFFVLKDKNGKAFYSAALENCEVAG